jgi:histidyl-tRNA synthetase
LQDENSAAKLGLRFDLTVPFARYISENAETLTFPFRRYSIGKVWRGERAQAGRYREFTQADIDIIGRQNSPVFEYEILGCITSALEFLEVFGLQNWQIHINSRKLIDTIFDEIGVATDADIRAEILIIVDKIAKIGADKCLELLGELGDKSGIESGIDSDVASKIIKLTEIKIKHNENAAEIISKAINIDLKDESIEILNTVLCHLSENVILDLSIARGLDYYTGLVFETFIDEDYSYGSICSGGAYESLVKVGKNEFPGIGISIGITRVLNYLFTNDLIDETYLDDFGADIFVALAENGDILDSVKIANEIRNIHENSKVIISSQNTNYGKQISEAEKLGATFVVFPNDSNENHQVKNIKTRTEIPWEDFIN